MHFHIQKKIENFEIVLDNLDIGLQEIPEAEFPVPASVSRAHSNCAIRSSLRSSCRKYTSPRGQIISVAFSGHFRTLLTFSAATTMKIHCTRIPSEHYRLTLYTAGKYNSDVFERCSESPDTLGHYTRDPIAATGHYDSIKARKL